MIVHGYFGIDEDIVWGVLKRKLTEFVNDLWQLINSGQIDISLALSNALNEKHSNSVHLFLEELNKLVPGEDK